MIKPGTDYHFTEILSQFSLMGTITEIRPYGSGHINGTYHIKTQGNEGSDYLLQRINSHVFKDIPALTNNILLVTKHLREKFAGIDPVGYHDKVLTLIATRQGEYFYTDTDANYWRVYRYIKNTISYDQAGTREQAYQSGYAFGQFQSLVTDLDATLLTETIPNFHNIDHRFDQLLKAVSADRCMRIDECRAELDFIYLHLHSMRQIIRMYNDNLLPLRITHNDTKFNNVLLDLNDRAQCVIDLDTVMPGLVAYDFGDAVRTIINSAPEDEPDLAKIRLNITLFEAYTKGYLEQASGFLTDEEVSSLIYGALLLPYIQAVRFLTDFLEGDHYFNIHFPYHNLQRARAQLQLVRQLQNNFEKLDLIIKQIAYRGGVTAMPKAIST